MIIKFQEPEP